MAKRSILCLFILAAFAGLSLPKPVSAQALVTKLTLPSDVRLPLPKTEDGGPIPMCNPDTGKCQNICPKGWICN